MEKYEIKRIGYMKLYIGDRVYQPTDIHPFGWGHGEVIEIDIDKVYINWYGHTVKYELSKIDSCNIKIDYQYRRKKKFKELGI